MSIAEPPYHPQVFYPIGGNSSIAKTLTALISQAFCFYQQSILDPAFRIPDNFNVTYKCENFCNYTLIESIYSLAVMTGERKLFGFVATDGNDLYAIFRGTQTLNEWVNNAEAFQAVMPGWGKVHHGFKRIYESYTNAPDQEVKANLISSAITSSNKQYRTIYCGGHSLGAAQATLVATEIRTELPEANLVLYTFSSPRVGDPLFAEQFGNRMQTTYRIFNTEDVVTEEPKAALVSFPISFYAYEHVGMPAPVTFQLGTASDNHSLDNLYLYL